MIVGTLIVFSTKMEILNFDCFDIKNWEFPFLSLFILQFLEFPNLSSKFEPGGAFNFWNSPLFKVKLHIKPKSKNDFNISVF